MRGFAFLILCWGCLFSGVAFTEPGAPSRTTPACSLRRKLLEMQGTLKKLAQAKNFFDKSDQMRVLKVSNDGLRALRSTSPKQRFQMELEAESLSLKDLQGKGRADFESLFQVFLLREEQNQAVEKLIVKAENQLPVWHLAQTLDWAKAVNSALSTDLPNVEGSLDKYLPELRSLFEAKISEILGFDPFHENDFIAAFLENPDLATDLTTRLVILTDEPDPPDIWSYWQHREQAVQAFEERVYAFLVASGELDAATIEVRRAGFPERYAQTRERILSERVLEDETRKDNHTQQTPKDDASTDETPDDGTAEDDPPPDEEKPLKMKIWLPPQKQAPISKPFRSKAKKKQEKAGEREEPNRPVAVEGFKELRPLMMMSNAQKEIQSWDPELRKKVGYLLFKIQKGEALSANVVSDFSMGGGQFTAKELRVKYINGTQWRVIFSDLLGPDIVVLHAFQKTRNSGRKLDYEATYRAVVQYEMAKIAVGQ